MSLCYQGDFSLHMLGKLPVQFCNIKIVLICSVYSVINVIAERKAMSDDILDISDGERCPNPANVPCLRFPQVELRDFFNAGTGICSITLGILGAAAGSLIKDAAGQSMAGWILAGMLTGMGTGVIISPCFFRNPEAAGHAQSEGPERDDEASHRVTVSG